MPLAANTRFERYNRGDVISERDEGRFRGTYPHSVVELSVADMEALEAARKAGSVGVWIEDVANRPSLRDAEAAASVPVVAPKAAKRSRGKTAHEPKPARAEETVAVDPVSEDGEE